MGTEQNSANQNDPQKQVGDRDKPVIEYGDKERQQEQDEASESQRMGEDGAPEKKSRLPG